MKETTHCDFCNKDIVVIPNKIAQFWICLDGRILMDLNSRERAAPGAIIYYIS